MMTGRGRPKNAITHSSAPNEKNQNSSLAQSFCEIVARVNAVKKVWVNAAQNGSNKIAMVNLTQRVGTISGGAAERATAARRVTDFPRLLADLRFFAANLRADYAK